MKRYAWLNLVCLIAGCSTNQQESSDGLPGVYTTYYTDEYSERFDTLLIKPVSIRRSDAFTIEKLSVAKKVLDGRVLPNQKRVKHWDGIYDHQSGSILLEPGKLLYYNREGEQVLIGKQRFQKIKSLP